MKTIRDHIKNQSFVPCYLLYGKEEYLKQTYRDRLILAMGSSRESMNFSRYEGNCPGISEFQELVNTPPFLEERRVVLLENTKIFESSQNYADVISKMSETTFLIFLEENVDKRSHLYHYIRDNGYVSEMNGLTEEECKLFVASMLKKEGLQITEKDAEYLLEMCGSNLVMLQNEILKLASYCANAGVVTRKDMDTICTSVTEGRIFWMLDAMMGHQKKKAMKLYADLLSMHEKPGMILYHLNRSFLQFAQVTAMLEDGISAADIAKRLSVAPFIVTKYQKLKKGFSKKEIRSAVQYGTELERKVKTGDLEEHMAVEMFIMKYSG